MLALGLGACGGDDEDVGPAPDVRPPDLTVPGEENAPETPDATDTQTTETAPAPGTTTPTTPTTPTDPAQPGADAAPDGPANDTPPLEGSPAERYEAFCEANPGACE